MIYIQYLLTALLSIFFIFASSIKLFAWQKTIFDTQMAFMRKYGLNRQILFLIGCVELFGAITIWFFDSWLGLAGVLALFLTSVGAIGFHLKFDKFTDGVPALITAVLSFAVLLIGWIL